MAVWNAPAAQLKAVRTHRGLTMSLLGILENIIADIGFLVLAIFLGWIWVFLTRRRKLQRFFGATTSKRITVYLSNIRVLPFGAAGVSGQRMSYQGSAIPNGEMQGATRIRDLHSFLVPSIAEPEGSLRRLLFTDVLVQILVSPLSDSELDVEAPFIAFGSPAYNTASAYIEDKTHSSATFRSGILKESDVQPPSQTGPTVAYSTDAGEYISPSGTAWYPPGTMRVHKPRRESEEESTSAIILDDVPDITDPTYGFVQRVFDQDNGRKLFYVAGLSEFSTRGAAYYLANEWQRLHKKYSEDTSFIIMLRFDVSDTSKWSIVFEKDLSD